MKAVNQIIEDLSGRGLLSKEQLVELASDGFLRWEEVYGDQPEEAEPVDEPASREVIVEEGAAPVYRTRLGARRAKSGHRKVPVLEPSEICARLARQFDAWRGDLAGLVRLARRLSDCTTWEEAAVILRNAGPGELSRALTTGLGEQDPSLSALWNALTLESYRNLLNEPGLGGPAASAYRAMLAVADHAFLGKHGWLLREREVAEVFNLKQAQQQVIRACGAVLSGNPDLFAAGLRRDAQAPGYWACVLLYTARRGQPAERPLPSGAEHRPARGAPTEAGWQRAWAQATAMDAGPVAALLIETHVLDSQRLQAVSYALRRFSRCLKQLDRDLLDLYYGKVLEPAAITVLLGIPPPEVEQRRTGLRESLAEALQASPTLQIPLLTEPASERDAFVDDCLRLGVPPVGRARVLALDLVECVKGHFGPTADLLCPKNWD